MKLEFVGRLHQHVLSDASDGVAVRLDALQQGHVAQAGGQVLQVIVRYIYIGIVQYNGMDEGWCR